MHDDAARRHPLPRSVLLALWLGAARGPGDVERAVRAVQGDDEPHTVVLAGDAAASSAGAPGGGPDDLPALLDRWVGARVRAVAALLPAPGHPSGVPATVAPEALDAGEAVLVTTGAGTFAAVPGVERFGSDLEPGHLVTWTVHAVDPWETHVLGAVGDVTEADRELRGALGTAVEALDHLDVARWREDAADAVAQLRSPLDLRGWVPPTTDARRVDVLSRAARLRAIVDLAVVDDGAAVNLWQSDQRSAALHAVDHAARRATSAATVHVPA